MTIKLWNIAIVNRYRIFLFTLDSASFRYYHGITYESWINTMKFNYFALLIIVFLTTGCSQTLVKTSHEPIPEDLWNMDISHQLSNVVIGLVEQQCHAYLTNVIFENDLIDRSHINDFEVYAKSRYDNEVNYDIKSYSGQFLADLKLEKKQVNSTNSCQYTLTVATEKNQILTEQITDLEQWQKDNGYLSISQFLQNQQAVLTVAPIIQPSVVYYEPSPGEVILTGLAEAIIQVAVEEILCGLITGSSCHSHGYGHSRISSISTPRISHSTFK